MIWRAATFALLAGLAGPALSQVAPVRSGEHSGFTRLAVDMPARIEWQQIPRENGMTLLFETDEVRFDTTDVFRRLTSNRLAEISSPDPGGRLDIKLGCDCPVDLFWHMDDMLVIDIRDVVIDEARPPAQSDPPPHQGIAARLDTVSPATEMLATSLSARAESVTGPVMQLQASPSILEIRDHLEAEIRGAALAGMLDPSKTRTVPRTDVKPADPNGPGPTSPLDTVEGDRKINLAILAPGEASRPGSAGVSQDRVLACLPDRLVSVTDWGNQNPLTTQLGRLNRRLMQEFDRTDTGVALNLGRLYIHFGFGAEAMQVVSLDGLSGQAVKILREMAEIVDNLHLSTPGRLHHDLGCPGLSAVWAVLAHEVIPPDALLDSSAILRSFQGLPNNLRRHFGPELSRRLTAAGHMETADMVLRANRYTRPTETPGRALALAELDFAEGRSDDATAALSGDLTRNTTHGAEAVLRLIGHQLERGEQVSYDVAQLAGAFYQQHRDDQIAPRLGRAYVLGLAASGAFHEAKAEYGRIKPALPEDAVSDIERELTKLVTETSEDTIFLQHAVEISRKAPASLPADLAMSVAVRMMGLGFNDSAKRIIDNVPSSDRDDGYRMAQAQLELNRGNPQAVETILQGMSGPQVSGIKARARSAMGDYRNAEVLYSEAEDEKNAQNAAWLGRNWASLADMEDGDRKRLAELLSQSDAPAAGLLQSSKLLISRSTETRDLLSAVLNGQTGSDSE